MPDADHQLALLQAVEPEARFVVRESLRARRMTIKVHPLGRVEIVVPRRTKPRAVEQFVREHRGWIDRTAREMSLVDEVCDAVLPERIELRALGRAVDVEYRREPGKQLRLERREDRLILRGPVHREAECRRKLKGWLMKIAREELVPMLSQRSRQTGLSYRRVQVRAQRTRWGSYSCTGTLCINYCLVFLDAKLDDYLFVHELCHIRHMNHSARYWRFVERFLPDYRHLDKALGDAWKDVPPWVLLT